MLEWSEKHCLEAGLTPVVFKCVLHTLGSCEKRVRLLEALKLCASVGDNSAGYEALRFPVMPDVGDPAGLYSYLSFSMVEQQANR